MILRIKNKRFDFFESFNVSLKYDSIASVFSFDAHFDPNNAEHKDLFRPGGFPSAVLEHDGEVLITGTLLTPRFKSSPQPELTAISGYSKTGVLEDSDIPTSLYPLQCDGLSLKNITEKLLKPFGIKLIIDPAVASKAESSYSTITASHSQKVKSFLAELAAQKHVMLTHDQDGNLVLTEAKTKQAPLFDFTQGLPGVTYHMDFDGQSTHSTISVINQTGKDSENAGQSNITNPYAGSAYRPRVVRQSSGTDNDSGNSARNVLSEELKATKVTIELDRWTLNDKIIRPNNMISIHNPEIYIYNKTNFFIEEVSFKGDKESQTATLTCFLPEVYNTSTAKNIFL